MSIRKVSFLGLISAFLASRALGAAIPNWSAPATWSPPKASRGLTTLGDISGPLPFIGVTPCRQYDSRSVAHLSDNTNLAVTLTGAPCGLPASAQAVSVNITVFDITGAGGNGVFRVGTANDPTTAWINYPPTETQRGNAGVLPLNGSGQIVVKVNQGGGSVDFTVDINGYYSPTPASNTSFVIQDSAPVAIWGATFSTVGGATGVYGFAAAGAGAGSAFGVSGIENSPAYNSAGVKGVDYSGTPTFGNYVPAGVRGESLSAYGVLGLSRSYGVAGAVHDSTGTQIAYGILGTTNGTVTYGVYSGGDFGGSGAKYFVEPHPTDASKVIRYVSLEGPESGTYFRGRGRFQDGLATIEVPEDFRMVTDSEGLSIQVTPIGDFASVAVVQMGLDEIVVKATRNVEFFYTVNGVRRTHRDLKPIGPGTEFMPGSADARMPAYLTEGQKAMLISNGTYNPDGTVNMETAERVGWTKMWADREARARAAAAANAAAYAPMMGLKK